MKILHTADWHIGSFKGPEKDGVNLRSLDTYNCLMALVDKAIKETPDLTLVSGDIFHAGKTWSERCCEDITQAINIIELLVDASKEVVVMRGTPNHDGIGQFKVLSNHFKYCKNVHIVTKPTIIPTHYADIAVLPGFDKGVFRAKYPGLGNENENIAFTNELSNIAMGLKAKCRNDRPSILMAHYTVDSCDSESGQTQFFSKVEPILTAESLDAANYDLIALGHIHKPQQLPAIKNAFYSGSINANNFKDENQERGFWIHDFESDLPFENVMNTFVKTPYREFITLNFSDTDITAILQGHLDEIAESLWRWNNSVKDKIVRVLYECSAEKKKAFNTALIEKTLYEDGAFWVAEIIPEQGNTTADRTDLSVQTDPEENLKTYLEEKQIEPEVIDKLIEKARPVIAETLASKTGAAFSGIFEPVEIEVENYRNYIQERFRFDDISFCTINGQNGAGKSSLFMDALIDVLYEEPREGEVTGWVTNDDKGCKGSIKFTFRVGLKTFRVTRTRTLPAKGAKTQSGKATLDIAELVEGEWLNRSKEKTYDTQKEIINIIGMDSLTFKSCALIMQDQYGLFLQAKPRDRMVVLGNLLGLELYNHMEKKTKDIGTEIDRSITAKKQSIQVQIDNIQSAGNAVEELKVAELNQKMVEKNMADLNLKKDSAVLQLNDKKSAQERHIKLMDSIKNLEEKKRNTEEYRSLQSKTIMDCESILIEEGNIIAQVGKYRNLVEREKQLIEGATLYNAKSEELLRLNLELKNVKKEVSGHISKLESLNKQLENVVDQDGREDIKSKAAEYMQKKEQLEKMYAISQEYSQLTEVRNRKAYALESKKAYYNEQEKVLANSKSTLEGKADLLKDSGCFDLDNARCRFLADAVEARSILQDYPEKIHKLEQERDEALEILEKELERAEQERTELGYSVKALEELQHECITLKGYALKLQELQERESQIDLIKASIENVQSNISKCEERLDTLEIQSARVGEERTEYQSYYDELTQVQLEIGDMDYNLFEREKQLPVVKERKANAEKRLLEIERDIDYIENDILNKQTQAQEEKEAAKGIVELNDQVNCLQADLNQMTKQSKENQIAIGGLKQKIEDIDRMKKAIEAIQSEITAMSEDAVDYNTLRQSFSQDGIPHQIVRTVIPKLCATANNILGQMTGGQLGVEFKTEKILKSNNKKEVVTLDIFIEEYGKGSLPYLSKSGGEKVKASLSVILALAEIKASTAGIQFGMLFIDEPPFLDAEGIQSYCDSLETIRERYPDIKIMAITHDPTFKSRFPQSLDVVKTENGSKVIY